MTTTERRAYIDRETLRLKRAINAAKARREVIRRKARATRQASNPYRVDMRGSFKGARHCNDDILKACAALDGFTYAVSLFKLHGGL